MTRLDKASADSESIDTDLRVTLGLLEAVHERRATSQRLLASELGIALGLANSYLKRCIKKGLIKVKQAPANRYAYYLTPQGFKEKSRLTAKYLSMSLDFFRHARTQCAEVFADCAERGWSSVVLAGAGDLGEIATLCGREYPLEISGFLDSGAAADSFAGYPVLAADDPRVLAADGLIVTDMSAPQETYEALVADWGAERVLAPRLLGISR